MGRGVLDKLESMDDNSGVLPRNNNILHCNNCNITIGVDGYGDVGDVDGSFAYILFPSKEIS